MEKLYHSFSIGDPIGMKDCYHNNSMFQDPVFGVLKGDRVGYMWEMLLSKKEAELKIIYNIIEVDDRHARVHWIATYYYGPRKRKVINNVTANFEFSEGKISRHIDDFNLWTWSKQALGISGYLLGWSSYMKEQIQNKTREFLNSFIEKRTASA